MENPKDLKYSNEHVWIKVEDDTATLGITFYAQDQLGDIVHVEVETIGETLEKDSTFGVVEAVKTASDLIMPISGTVTQLNEELEADPELINTDCFDKGWIVKIEIENKEELKDLFSADEYQAEIAE